jgi:AraC-like DNA-binding protein
MGQYRGGLSPVQLRRVTSFVHEYLHEDVSLIQMAEEAKLSPAYFSQMCRQSTGVAPHQFVLRARVKRAKELLVKKRTRPRCSHCMWIPNPTALRKSVPYFLQDESHTVS